MSRDLPNPMKLPGLLLGMLVVALVTPAFAHEGPEHEVEELTERIKAEPPSAELLILRAIEYKVLGKFAEAARDLEEALALSADSTTARRELSLAYFELGKTNEALAEVNLALRSPAPPGSTPDPIERASLHMVRSGILRARRDFAGALSDANDAIQRYPQNVEWYLIRSQLQATLQRKAERIEGLEAGIRETGSGLLAAERVDALLEAGAHEKAMEVIERELSESRWRATWLIRRARARMAAGDTALAREDLGLAVAELDQRLSVGVPDALLLADRGRALDLLGRRDEARRDYRAALGKGLTDEWLRARMRALRGSGRSNDD